MRDDLNGAMKPTHKLLFVLCPMLVLVFIYYSSEKLQLYVWGQKPQRNSDREAEATTVAVTKGAEVKGFGEMESDVTVGRIVSSVYDKQGFLLQLETKLPPELEYKYGNLSKGACKPGYAAAKMATIYPKFIKSAPMFLDRNFKRLGKISYYLPPFGIRTQERIIDSILTATKNYGLGEKLDSLSCKRCIIVGNGGILFNKSLGTRIDDYDVVVRLNEAPVKGYSRDVGTKTTLRITYPEGAIQNPENYEKDSLFVFLGFKPLDFRWFRHIVFKENVGGLDGFWKSVAHRVPREPTELRILNPYFIQEAAFHFIGLPFNNGLMGKGDTFKLTGLKNSWTHDISKEKEFLRKLVKANVITDLTKGI
ncbi:ST3 beta-galactoside alpha-2,3-sialyltransferase 3b [Nematolebias whitei]|uniref:ST3 beta-galactoside alpha-2,3-sialyltransferase 3b n=1 Tax=Nematolebias whitei TaxID=451745 RepID=UPI00189BEB5B|nr:ST3 beta-galactoside alpha-2,3-sialyltransferase 3b [Nematolebias whitei]